MKKITFAIILFLLIFQSHFSYAEIAVTSSIEWLADHCIDSGLYQVHKLATKEGLINGYTCYFKLSKKHRGNPPESVSEKYYRTLNSEPIKYPIVKEGDEFLIFWQHYIEGDRRIVHMINISNPALSCSRFIAVNSKLKLLKNKEEILRTFEARLKEKSIADPVLVGDYSKDNRVKIPYDIELFKAVFSGSSCYIRIPLDLINKENN